MYDGRFVYLKCFLTFMWAVTTKISMLFIDRYLINVFFNCICYCDGYY